MKLKDMKNGQTIYTMPWFMCADKQKRIWLNPEALCYHDYTPGKAHSLIVSKWDNQFIVNTTLSYRYKWELKKEIDPDFIPVAKLILCR